ncbi:transposase [Neisseria mucosa]|uniref:transposase n=1 Tax=Neisseria mucosa TaxID=488 RepID=UPI0026A09F8E
MHDFTVWVSYGKWRKNGDIRYCLLHLIHLSSTRLRRCGRILSGICEPYCLITPDLTMRYCPILILIDYILDNARFHRMGVLREMAEKWGHKVLPLAPYSSELNPIEKVWANIKRYLRTVLSDYARFDDTLLSYFDFN